MLVTIATKSPNQCIVPQIHWYLPNGEIRLGPDFEIWSISTDFGRMLNRPEISQKRIWRAGRGRGRQFWHYYIFQDDYEVFFKCHLTTRGCNEQRWCHQFVIPYKYDKCIRDQKKINTNFHAWENKFPWPSISLNGAPRRVARVYMFVLPFY
jgi:hypothetical protein